MNYCYTPALDFLISFFESIKDYTIKTNYLLPRNLRKDFEEMFMLSLYLFVKSGNLSYLEDEILKFNFMHSKLQKSRIPPSEASIFPRSKYDKNYKHFDQVILFENLEIDNKKAKYISKLLSSPMAHHYIDQILFMKCHITGKFDLDKTMYTCLHFHKCRIDTSIKFPRYTAGRILFLESMVSKNIIFDCTSIYGFLRIKDCHFMQTSTLKMKQVTFVRKGITFEVEDSVFDGDISISNTDALYARTYIQNVKVGGNFSFLNFYLHPGSVIENVSARNSKNIVSQLKKCFFESEYITGEKQIKSIEDKNSDIETQTNWYPRKKAAEYIGRSVVFLAKMKERDKIKPQKDSIPFLGEYKSIVYPKDALDAYLAKDYQKLEQLRKKYNYIKN